MDAFAIKIGLVEKEEKNENNIESIKKILRETEEQLNRAHTRFDFLVDEDLIESQIYEIRALKARYSYYLKKAKVLSSCF